MKKSCFRISYKNSWHITWFMYAFTFLTLGIEVTLAFPTIVLNFFSSNFLNWFFTFQCSWRGKHILNDLWRRFSNPLPWQCGSLLPRWPQRDPHLLGPTLELPTLPWGGADLHPQEDAAGITAMTWQAWVIEELLLPMALSCILAPGTRAPKLGAPSSHLWAVRRQRRPAASSQQSGPCKPREERPWSQVPQQPSRHQASICIKDAKSEPPGEAALKVWQTETARWCLLLPEATGFWGPLCRTNW